MADNPFIVCEGLVKIYKVANLEVVALQGLDIIVSRGELLGIVGASGSGKTTLMNILGGLDRPSAGRVWIDGLDLLKMSDTALNRYRRSKVGFVWQQGARNLIPYLSALENVKLPMTLSGQALGNEQGRAEALLEAVGLTERRHHRLLEMSGGEQQRVAIAVALANNPSLLLADEPTGEVDSVTAAGIFKVIRELNQQLGVTILIVSHDLGLARYVDRVVAIRDGKTSSETVRQAATAGAGNGQSRAAPAGSQDGKQLPEDIFEEVVLLDSAGRLQLPREYLESLNIKGRAHVELVKDGILVRPALASEQDLPITPLTEETEPASEARGLFGWWKRLRRENQPGGTE
jgi:putative ABC transport system ATP-binding protein